MKAIVNAGIASIALCLFGTALSADSEPAFVIQARDWHDTTVLVVFDDGSIHQRKWPRDSSGEPWEPALLDCQRHMMHFLTPFPFDELRATDAIGHVDADDVRDRIARFEQSSFRYRYVLMGVRKASTACFYAVIGKPQYEVVDKPLDYYELRMVNYFSGDFAIEPPEGAQEFEARNWLIRLLRKATWSPETIGKDEAEPTAGLRP